jgi:hypothetical protein
MGRLFIAKERKDARHSFPTICILPPLYGIVVSFLTEAISSQEEQGCLYADGNADIVGSGASYPPLARASVSKKDE